MTIVLPVTQSDGFIILLIQNFAVFFPPICPNESAYPYDMALSSGSIYHYIPYFPRCCVVFIKRKRFCSQVAPPWVARDVAFWQSPLLLCHNDVSRYRFTVCARTWEKHLTTRTYALATWTRNESYPLINSWAFGPRAPYLASRLRSDAILRWVNSSLNHLIWH